MKKIICCILCIVQIVLCSGVVNAAEDNTAKVYVTSYGNDLNDGSQLNSAVSSLERAQEVARIHASKGKRVDVILEGGIYSLDNTLTFTEQDSGASAENPIVYRPYQGEYVSFTMGKKINSDDFTTSKDSRIATQAQGKVYEADLSHISNLTGGTNSVLYADGTMQTMSRWPNNSYASLAAGSECVNIPEDKGKAWKGNSDMHFGFWVNDYSYAVEPIKSVTNTYIQSTSNIGSTRCLVFNALCEVDSPGEYYIDTSAKKLYYYPKDTLNNVYLATGSKDVIYLNGAKNIKFENIDIFCSAAEGFDMVNSDNITVYSSKITGINGNAIQAKETTNLLVCACEITDVNAGGIDVSGGDQVTLTSSNNVIRNTSVYNYGKLMKTAYGITAGGVGVTVSHCEVYDASHQAIVFAGNDIVIEYNKIHDVMKESWDAGAIYCGRSWINRGCVIRNNYIYNTYAMCDFTKFKDSLIHTHGLDNHAIYLDDLQSDVKVTGNIAYNMSRAWIIGGGSDITWSDNIAIDCRRGMAYDGEGAGGWRVQHIDPDQQYLGRIYKDIKELLADPNYYKEKWYEKYPSFKSTIERIDDYDKTVEADPTNKPTALWYLGSIYNNKINHNYYAGEFAQYYYYYNNANYLNFSRSWTYDCNEEYASLIWEKWRLGLEMTDDYEMTFSGTGLSAGVSRSTNLMGVQKDDYVPSFSVNEFDVNSGNRFKLYVAIYDGSDRLVTVQSFDEAYIYDGQKIEEEIDIPANAEEDWYVNTYFWSADGRMIPVGQKAYLFGGAIE